MDEVLSPDREVDPGELRQVFGDFERLAWKGSRLTRRRVDNYVLNYEEERRGATVLKSYPWKLTVEATNICNLRCTACPTGAGEIGRARGHMPIELFSRVFDEMSPYLIELELHNWGEPLLAKHIFELIRRARDAGVSTTASTNFSVPFDEERAEQLASSGLTLLGVSLDGARQESYERYRVRGDLDLVLRNCRMLIDAKKRLGAELPSMIWDFHVFKHNVDDIEVARRMAEDLGMIFCAHKGWVVGPEWDPDQQYRFFLNPSPNRCHFLWHQAVVNNDGGVAPCCGSFYQSDDIGRIAITPDDLDAAATFGEVWNGQKYQIARALFQSRTGSEDTQKSICFNCPATVVWERYRAHEAQGGTVQNFDVGIGTNECFNFFWNRKSSADAIPLRRKVAPAAVEVQAPVEAVRSPLDEALARCNQLEAEGHLVDAVAALRDACRARPEPALLERLRAMRHAAFATLDRTQGVAEWPPQVEPLPLDPLGLPVTTAAELTPEIVRRAVFGHGSLIVRGLLDRATTANLRNAIRCSLDGFDAAIAGASRVQTSPWFSMFDPLPGGFTDWSFSRQSGNVYMIDSPKGFFDFFEMAEARGIVKLVTDIFGGERPAVSAQKCSLRCIGPGDLTAWHQDGAFLGSGIRSMNLWIALSPCGRDAPGMDIIPKRIEQLLPDTGQGTWFPWSVSEDAVREQFPGIEPVRPEFEEGDAMFFDHLCLHRTWRDQAMVRDRYAIECWFFAPSGYPDSSWLPFCV